MGLREFEEDLEGERRGSSMEDGDLIELKFRLADGKDIGPSMYSSAITVASLKENIVAQWPKDKENSPKTINEVKLINAGRILDNDRTLAECRVTIGELPGVVTTMHVLVRPPLPEKKIEKQLSDSSKTPKCGCTIL